MSSETSPCLLLGNKNRGISTIYGSSWGKKWGRIEICRNLAEKVRNILGVEMRLTYLLNEAVSSIHNLEDYYVSQIEQ